MFRQTLSCLLLALTGAIAPVLAGTPGEVPVGQFLRDATLHGLNGPDRSLAAYRGKPLIINVWASWCGPCRAEMASLERLAWLSHPVPFAVIGISTDDDPAAALQFLKIANSTLTHYLDRGQALENELGADRIPLTLLIDARGRVVSKVRGAQQWDSPAALRQIHGAFSSTGGSSKP
jgi:thiol-disulfide isomerase/thioredoxin